MNPNLRIFLVVSIMAYLGIIFYLLKNKRLNLKYTLTWLFSALILLIVAIFPGIVSFIAEFVGIVETVNVVFVLEAMFVLVILLSITSIVSHIGDRNRRLIQQVAIQEKRLRELEEKIAGQAGENERNI